MTREQYQQAAIIYAQMADQKQQLGDDRSERIYRRLAREYQFKADAAWHLIPN